MSAGSRRTLGLQGVSDAIFIENAWVIGGVAGEILLRREFPRGKKDPGS